MEVDHNGKKRRLHIVLSLDNPLQRETWEILSQQNNKTSAVCEAVCGYHRQKNLEDTLRSVLRDELKHITAAPLPQVAGTEESPGADMDASILAFLQDLQNE